MCGALRPLLPTLFCSFVPQHLGPFLFRVKAIPEGSRSLRLTDFDTVKVVRLSALCTGRLYSTGKIPGTYFCYILSQSQGHFAAGRIVSMEISSDTIGNRTRILYVF